MPTNVILEGNYPEDIEVSATCWALEVEILTYTEYLRNPPSYAHDTGRITDIAIVVTGDTKCGILGSCCILHVGDNAMESWTITLSKGLVSAFSKPTREQANLWVQQGYNEYDNPYLSYIEETALRVQSRIYSEFSPNQETDDQSGGPDMPDVFQDFLDDLDF